jgi:hypothetical protein
MALHPRPVVDISGTCACGAVTMSVKGTVLSMIMCACNDCQRATGTGHATIAIVNRDELTVTGEVKSFGVVADSGATLTRHFCPTCGTPLYGVSSRREDRINLPVGFFRMQNDWFQPNQVIFDRSSREWDSFPEHLPRHATYRGA